MSSDVQPEYDSPFQPDRDPATPPPIPSAPPTQPGEIALPPRRTVWPTPIGIITIVLSAWTVLSAFQSVAMGLGGSFMSASATGSDEETMIQVLEQAGPFFITAGVLLAIAAGLGIGGGIGLLMRKRWAVLVLFVFAAWKILASAYHGYVQANWMSVMMEASMQSAGQAVAGAPPPGMMMGMGLMMGVSSFVFGAVFPAFILIWLLMPNIKKDYKGW